VDEELHARLSGATRPGHAPRWAAAAYHAAILRCDDRAPDRTNLDFVSDEFNKESR